MMPTLTEGQLRFQFPDQWQATKFDAWSFYCRQFMKLAEARLSCSKCEADVRCAECGNKKVAGTKGVDFLAIDPDSTTCWHIEVKDYRQTKASDFAFLADTVALKVRDTLACLVAAQFNANEAEEKRIAHQAVRASRHRIVLHLEQPASGRSLHSTVTRRANVLARLKQLIKAIDPHPIVIDMTSSGGVRWTVAEMEPP